MCIAYFDLDAGVSALLLLDFPPFLDLFDRFENFSFLDAALLLLELLVLGLVLILGPLAIFLIPLRRGGIIFSTFEKQVKGGLGSNFTQCNLLILCLPEVNVLILQVFKEDPIVLLVEERIFDRIYQSLGIDHIALFDGQLLLWQHELQVFYLIHYHHVFVDDAGVLVQNIQVFNDEDVILGLIQH